MNLFGLDSLWGSPEALSNTASKLALHANPDPVMKALEQWSSGGLPPLWNPPYDPLAFPRANPPQAPSLGALLTGQKINLANSTQMMPASAEVPMPVSLNLDKLTALAKLIESQQAERPPQAPAASPRPGQSVNLSAESLAVPQVKYAPRAATLAQLLGLLR